jgi:hypothetical protein
MVPGGSESLRITHGSEQKDGPFHRVPISPGDVLKVRPGDKPVAVWVPSGYEVRISSDVEVVLDCAEAIEHHDVVTMDLAIQRKNKEIRYWRGMAKRARRLRRDR